MGEVFISPEFLMWPAMLFLLAVSGGLSWGLSRWWSRRELHGGAQIFVAGLAPLVLLVTILWVWDRIERAEHAAQGLGPEYMGPLLLLIYGFPFLIIMVVVDFLAAIAALKRQ